MREIDADRLNAPSEGPTIARYFGKGYLAFTVDQGPDTERYQGIVELKGGTLVDSARAYFERSEQLATELVLAVRAPCDGVGWRAGAAMIQRMPIGPTSPIVTADESEEVWNRSVILLKSLRDDELLDPGLSSGRLVHRLFHEDRFGASTEKALQARCRCSGGKGAAARCAPSRAARSKSLRGRERRSRRHLRVLQDPIPLFRHRFRRTLRRGCRTRLDFDRPCRHAEP